jgi:hypothetical protein
MSSSLASHYFIDAVAVSHSTVFDNAVAQSPALVFIEGSPYVLLDADSEVFLAATRCDAYISITGNIVDDDIYYVAAVCSFLSHHTSIIAPCTEMSSRRKPIDLLGVCVRV